MISIVYNSLKKCLIVLMLLSIVSCGSDDSSDPNDMAIDPSELLTFYVEPFKEFGTLPEALFASEGQPDSQPGDTSYRYHPDYPGIILYGYQYFSDFFETEPATLKVCAIRVHAHQQNLDFLIDALTELYGEPEIIEIEELLSVEYKFTPQNGEYTVSVYPPSDFSTINVTILVNYFAVDL